MSTAQSVNSGSNRRVSKRSVLAVLMVVLFCASVVYWYFYGRERDLLDRSKAWGQVFLSLNGRLGLTPDNGGSTLSGGIVSNKENWVINKVYVTGGFAAPSGSELHKRSPGERGAHRGSGSISGEPTAITLCGRSPASPRASDQSQGYARGCYQSPESVTTRASPWA
jgi:hypothetical protein